MMSFFLLLLANHITQFRSRRNHSSHLLQLPIFNLHAYQLDSENVSTYNFQSFSMDNMSFQRFARYKIQGCISDAGGII